MSRIDELMAAGLPSKRNNSALYEGADCGECGAPIQAECTPNGVNKVEDADEDIEKDLEELSDEDFEGISDEDLEGISEDELAALDGDDDEDDEEELDEDEVEKADATMALAATPLLLKGELEEEAAFEALADEFSDMVSEGFLFESDADMFFEPSNEIFTEKRVFASKTKIMLDEKDRRKQLFEVGVQASARAHNDPTYWKLQKVYKLERLFKAKLRQKYKSEALRRVKAYVKKLKTSKSKILSGLANKIGFGNNK